MKITDEAKKMLKEIMISNDGDCLKAALKKSCCGSSFMLNIAKLSDSDVPISVNDITVLIEDDLKKRSETITITVQNEKLVIQDEEESGCCG